MLDTMGTSGCLVPTTPPLARPDLLRSVATGTNADGRIEMFGVDARLATVHRVQTKPGDWSGSSWTVLDGALTSIAMARNADGLLELFGTNVWDAVVHRVQTSPGTWSGSTWAVFGGLLTQVAAAANVDGRIELFGVDAQRALVHRAQTRPGTWDRLPWTVLDGTVHTIAVACDRNGVLELFATNADGHVMSRRQTGPGAGTWTAWAWLDAASQAQVNIRQLAVQNVRGRLTLFGVGIDGNVFYRTQNILNPNSWGDWVQLSGTSHPAILADPAPRLASPGHQRTSAGTPVNLALSASGSAPFGWTYAGLPAGLTGDASGRITGVPVGNGTPTSTVTVTLTDAAHLSSTVAFSWSITVTVPNILGLTRRQAAARMAAAGLAVGPVSIVRTRAQRHDGVVVAQSVPANTQVRQGGSVGFQTGIFLG